ncbi:UBP13 hydrolase, partial [Pardalotus punctatus]|nr:UBP13 hydrolase [Pardalotus punctatus]
DSEGGLYVCMNTFLGFGREHIERHYRKTGQCVYVHLKRHVIEKVPGASGGALPKRRNAKLFLGIVSSCFHTVLSACGLGFCPPLCLALGLLLGFLFLLRMLEVIVLRHLLSCVGVCAILCWPEPNLENMNKTFCIGSPAREQNVGKQREGITFHPGAHWFLSAFVDVYSFDEEEPVLDPHIAKHLAHFGIDMLQMQVTENGLRDNDIKPRVSEWEVIQEAGVKLKPMYGPGYTGMKNLGNSCYLNAVMQAIFSIPEFQRAYVGNLPRIFDYSPLDPTQDFNTQMAKLGHGLLSGQYSKPPMKSELIEQVMKEEHKPQHNGISPRMFKAFISKGHPEFSSNRQQDAQEFFLHLINLVERNPVGSENPSDVFRFLVEERTQCCQSRKVRYTERVDYIMQLPVAMEAATNKDELIAYELKRREAEAARRPLPELVRAKIPFSACLQAFSEPSNVEDFWSSALQAKSAGVKTSRFASFPEYLVVQIKKFTFGLDWIPKKLDVSIDMPDFLDISHLRARGLQPGEEELPDIAPPIVIPDDPKALDIDESSVMQLAEMGFPLEACRKAVYYTGNLGAEVAFNWIIAHMEEPDFAEPLVIPAFGEVASSGAAALGAVGLDNQPPEEMVAIIISMGFQRNVAIQALKATNNNLERALEWIFSHPDPEEESDPALDTMDMENNANANILAETGSEGPRIKDGPGRYELFGFISHMGTSTMSGHYVCHLRKEGRWVIYNDLRVCASERPPKDLGYIYFYHRIPS